HCCIGVSYHLGRSLKSFFFEQQRNRARTVSANRSSSFGLRRPITRGTPPGTPMDHPAVHPRDTHGTLFSPKRSQKAVTPSPQTRCARERPVNAPRTPRGRPENALWTNPYFSAFSPG